MNMNLCLRLVLLLQSCFIFNQVVAQGIEFVHDTTLVALKQRAKQANKPIFIDCYTSWCGPCKWMAKNIFPTDSAGNFYNANFICAKIDMEKGDGKNMAKNYKINGYPTFLFLDTAGKEIHRFMGSQSATKFVANGSNALNAENNWGSIKSKYKDGERSPVFLRKYILAAYNAGENVQEHLDWYIALVSKDELSDPENFKFFSQLSYFVRPRVFDQLYAHRARYIEKFGSQEVSMFIKGHFEKEVQNCYEMREITPGAGRYKFYCLDDKYAAFMKKMEAAEFDGKQEYIDAITQNNLILREDVQLLIEYNKTHTVTHAGNLNSMAWIIYQKSDKPEELKQAVTWAKKSVELESNYANTDTYAAVLYKLGNKKEAKKQAEKAIALAEKNGEDHSVTDELLKKINAMK